MVKTNLRGKIQKRRWFLLETTIDNMILDYKQQLLDEEKSPATVKKYVQDTQIFLKWCKNRNLTKTLVLLYKKELSEKLSPAGVNSVLSSLNSYFSFKGKHNLKTKMLKIQKQIFARAERELSKSEYMRLLETAKNKNNRRLYFLMQTVCSTGIRISEDI